MALAPVLRGLLVEWISEYLGKNISGLAAIFCQALCSDNRLRRRFDGIWCSWCAIHNHKRPAHSKVRHQSEKERQVNHSYRKMYNGNARFQHLHLGGINLSVLCT